jgi:mutual gliding-motility protein MglA
LVLFNYALKELTAKIVYYGPGLSGKTSNLQYIYEELPIKNKGRMLTLATETDRTLYFDFLPVDAGVVRGIKTRVQLYTVPGQVFYNATRRMVLKGADGVVFVADSQRSMQEANLESLDNLRDNLKAHDLKLEEMPIVLQFNKRDLEDIATLEEMSERLNKLNGPFYEAVAKEGVGVEETLQAISGLVLKSVIDRYGGDRNMTPLGRVASDPARTDPDAAAAIAASPLGKSSSDLGAKSEGDAMSAGLAGGRGRGGSVGTGPAKTSKAAATTWPSAPEEEKVRSDDGNPLEAFESLNIEGILDEALRLDDSDDVPAKPARAAAPPKSEPDVEEDSMFSGLLDEALGAQETESILDSVLGGSESKPHNTKPPRADSNPMGDLEAELMGVERFEEMSRDPGSGARPDLSELIKTRVSIPTDKIVTHSPAVAKEKPKERDRERDAQPAQARAASERIEVPITLHVDPSDLDRDIELLLKIRLKRKGK